MTALPALDPALAAGVCALPDRLVRRATKLAGQQSDWQIESATDGVTVVIGTATVTIAGPAEVGCDCLLAPDCAHRAAVISVCPIADTHPISAGTTDAPPTDLRQEHSDLTESQYAALSLAESAVGTTVCAGVAELAVAERAQLMRAVHLARNAGLHRVATTATALHAEPSTETLREAALAVFELRRAATARSVTVKEIGTARRAYEVSGSLRLDGLWCEPVLTSSGYAGVVTTLAAADGTTFTVNSVRPGTAADALRAYRSPAGLGDLLATHAEISRGRVLLTSATVSAEGRLGTGRTVRASLTAGPATPARLPDGVAEVTGLVVGAEPRTGTAALVVDDGSPNHVAAEPSPAATELGAIRLIRAICAHPGEQVTLRVRGGRLLAVRRSPAFWPSDGPGEWVHPGLDAPPASSPAAVIAPGLIAPGDTRPHSAVTPDEVLARWAGRVAVAGRPALVRGATQLADDVTWLRAHACPHRADLLERLGTAGAAGTDLTVRWLAVAIAARTETGW